MPHYVMLMNWTDQGVKTFKDTVDRYEGARDVLKAKGVTLKDIYWTVGAYDLVSIGEAADDETCSAALLALSSQGNLRTTTMRGFTPDEMRALIKRAG
jgi:uncharacterized protein with GYD domain